MNGWRFRKSSINILNDFILFAQVGYKPLDRLKAIEKPDGDDAHNGISGDGYQHADGAADRACHEYHDEDFQGMCLDTRRVDDGLIDEVVNHLYRKHDGEDDEDEHPDVDIQAGTDA